MRKNSIRKLIHGILDLLPLFIIPIFAININQKEVEPISITQKETKIVDFNQLFNDGDTYAIETAKNISSDLAFTYQNTHLYQLEFDIESKGPNETYIIGFWNGNTYRRSGLQTINNTDTHIIFRFNDSNLNGTLSSNENVNLILQMLGTYDSNNPTLVSNVEVFDLSQMFGVGNEPIISTFNKLFPLDYYQATTSEMYELNTSVTVLYDETDIGSQFLYSLYKPVNDYFNFNNLFNMNDVWNWIQLNLFSGTAPLPVFIIWNIIIYEFFVDLIFLLYSVFMFIIDFAENCLERPFDKIRRL